MARLRDRLIDPLRRWAGHDLPLRLGLRDWTAFDFGLALPLLTLRLASECANTSVSPSCAPLWRHRRWRPNGQAEEPCDGKVVDHFVLPGRELLHVSKICTPRQEPSWRCGL